MPLDNNDGRRARLPGIGHRGYPVKVDLQYRLWDSRRLSKTGTGRTIRISSRIISFESEDALPPGRRIGLIIPWPGRVQAQPGIRLELHVLGRTVGARGTRTTVEILHGDFRTPALRAQRNDQCAEMDPPQLALPCLTAQLTYRSAETHTREWPVADDGSFPQAVATAGDFNVDLQIDPAFEEAEVALVGQVVNRTASKKPLAGAPVRLLAREKLLATTRTNNRGEFCLVFKRQSGLRLLVEIEAPLQRVRIPLDKLTPRFGI